MHWVLMEAWKQEAAEAVRRGMSGRTRCAPLVQQAKVRVRLWGPLELVEPVRMAAWVASSMRALHSFSLFLKLIILSGSPYISVDESFTARFEARLVRPDSTGCIIC